MYSNNSLILPAEIVWLRDIPLVKMVEVDSLWLDTPFWSQTLAAYRRVIGLLPLDDVQSDAADRMRLSGFLYHFNRCGSTLVSNLFKTHEECLTLSEPFIFQQLLDNERGTKDLRSKWLKKLMTLHIDGLYEHTKYLVIKWPSLLSLYIEEIEETFPDVPDVFLYRNPVEVMVSARVHLLGNVDKLTERHLGMFGDSNEKIDDLPYMERVAFVMSNICRSVSRSTQVKLVDYTLLPNAVWQLMAPLFNIPITQAHIEKMMQAALFYSKGTTNKKLFNKDSERKNAMASEKEVRLANEIVQPELMRLLNTHTIIV